MPPEKSQISFLFKHIQLGNTNAFDELFLRYHDKLLGFALQYTKQLEVAEEITSELFVKIWLKRSTLSAVLNPEVYLFVAIKNACLNWIRADKKRNAFFSATDEELMQKIPNSEGNLVEEKELVKILDLTVSALPEQRRIIFKLIKEQGLKRHEVAEILGISVRTVENQLHKALINLSDEISGYLGYDPRKRNNKKLWSELNSLFFL
jgi:RNA polymerase sigma-70 factor (family 1)